MTIEDKTTDSTAVVDEDNQEEQAQDSTADGEKLFSQADLDRYIGKIKAKLKRQIKREFEQQKQGTSEEPSEGSKVEELLKQALKRIDGLEGKLSSKDKREQFKSTVSKLEGLSDKQREALYPHFNPEEPESVLGLAKEIFGLGEEKKPPAQKYVDPGAPSPKADPERISDPRKWTPDDIARLQAEGRFREAAERFFNASPTGKAPMFPTKDPRGKQK